MDRVPVVSSSLAAIGYDPPTKLLKIEFRNGSVYLYEGVSTEMYDGLASAESKGAFFNSNIRDRFPFVRLG